jgi:hypothetical protein
VSLTILEYFNSHREWLEDELRCDIKFEVFEIYRAQGRVILLLKDCSGSTVF